MEAWSEIADVDLVQRATAGDAAAVEHLLGRHQPWIFNLALYMLQVRADAEDATQEMEALQ
jgi:DNA-directed RNA polymerase specialized sigma24 family protein